VATAIDLLPTVNTGKAGGRLDLGTVVTFGASAGGHLAAWAVSRHRIGKQHLAALGGPPRQELRGALSYAGVLDLGLDSDNTGPSLALMDGTKERRPDRFAAGSPVALLPTGVPVVCMHGDADTVIPYEHSTRYVAKAKQAGDPATLVTLPGIDHPNVNPVEVGEPLWDQVRSHLDQLLGS
jgi:pimeloyl-ACP methyl ester carboxylesterase